MYQVIGRCSLCDGDVEIFSGPWFGVSPPLARCKKCGASEDRRGSVIPMTKDKVEVEYPEDTYYSYKSSGNFSDSFGEVFKDFGNIFKDLDKFLK